MFKTFINAIKIKEVRKKLLFTLAMLTVIRIGSQLPVPGVDPNFFAEWFQQQTGDAFSFFDAFTGGSFTSMSLFALNITPYITSSIIIQLLTIAIPKLEEMNKEEEGRKKMASVTRYVTVALALIESSAIAIGFGSRGLLNVANPSIINYVAIIASMTAGSTLLMWLGERITENGVGNGISIVLVINIVSRMPADIGTLVTTFVLSAGNAGKAVLAAVIIIAVILATVVLVVYLNAGVRKIPVQYAKKVQGSRMIGANNSHIPMRVNTAGVMPIIFASSLMTFPVVVCTLFNINTTGTFGSILKGLQSENWFIREQPVYTLGFLVYIVLVVFFAYFYTSITINPMLIADNMKKSGGFIPGIRPGKPTTEYLNNVLNYIIFMGAIGLILVAAIPIFFNGVFGAKVTFGGTSLIIVVSVVLETLSQIETMMLERNYKGFLNS